MVKNKDETARNEHKSYPKNAWYVAARRFLVKERNFPARSIERERRNLPWVKVTRNV